MHHKQGERFTYDVGAMLGWPDLFGTSDPEQVEKVCLEEGAPCPQWIGPSKDTFFQEWVDEPFQVHPRTSELVWFNHSQVFHWTTFPAELWYAFLRVRDIHLLFHCILVSIFSFVKYGLLGFKMNLDTTFGDGTPISWREMGEIRKVIHQNMVFSRWRKGDILCIDNFSTSHGRQPTYDKGRKVCVAWSDPQDKTISTLKQLVTKQSDPMTNNASASTFTTESIPDLVGLSPDNSPASTLTTTEANKLKVKLLLASNVGDNLDQDLSKPHGRASCPDLFESQSVDFWKTAKTE